jgi:hypothetical protein
MGWALDGLTRTVDRLLGRCAGLVPPGRRGWAEAVRAEAGEVPAGTARVGWLAGGLWLVAREAGMIRRVGYGLGVAAVAVAAALAVRYVWSGAHAGRDAWWDRARMLLLVALLAGLPWVARRRGVFGPVGRSVAARAVRAGGGAALVALVLDYARIEHYRGPSPPDLFHAAAGAWGWAQEAAVVGLVAACLAAILIVPAWWPRARPVLVAWCAVAAGLVLFFTVAPLQVLIACYTAGILAVTSQRSPATPATLAISSGVGVTGGLLVVALHNPLRSPSAPGLHPKTNVILLFLVLVVVTAAGTAAAGAVAARRASGSTDPLELKARAWQYLAAGPLTAASAALMVPLLRASPAVHAAAGCPATNVFPCTSAPAVWMFFLVAGPILGLAIGTGAGAVIAAPQPPTQPSRKPPPEPPPGPPREPEPDGSRWGGVFVKM